MDRVALIVLRVEVLADCGVIADAARLARERLATESPAGAEACAFQLARLYNAIEQLGLRIAKAFENNIDDDHGWHMELLRRLSLPIPGIRPALLQPELLAHLNELRGFRHVVRHAYDLVLHPEKLRPLLDHADRVALQLPQACEAFMSSVAATNGWKVAGELSGAGDVRA